jgi:hypothetical protein
MQALKRAREYRALPAIFSVEVHGVAGGELGHELGEVAGSPFPDHQMKPVRHETVSDDVDERLPSLYRRKSIVVSANALCSFHIDWIDIIATVKQKSKTKKVSVINKHILTTSTLIVDVIKLFSTKSY